MLLPFPTRWWLLPLLVLTALAVGAPAQRGARAPRGGRHFSPPAATRVMPRPRAPLGSGLERLSQVPPAQREQQLRASPDFQKLPPERQQQLLNGLKRLNAMTPEQQQRTIERLHDLGKLNPEQRAGLEQIFVQFQTMPPDRRRAFRQAYNNLRMLPPEQRELRMAQPGFQQRFSSDERTSLHQALGLNLPPDVVGARPPGGND
ncbi:MAG: DUF3106 domain-containing protein [Terriglobales bacterium]